MDFFRLLKRHRQGKQAELVHLNKDEVDFLDENLGNRLPDSASPVHAYGDVPDDALEKLKHSSKVKLSLANLAAMGEEGADGVKDTDVALIPKDLERILRKLWHHGHKQINPKTGFSAHVREGNFDPEGLNIDIPSWDAKVLSDYLSPMKEKLRRKEEKFDEHYGENLESLFGGDARYELKKRKITDLSNTVNNFRNMVKEYYGDGIPKSPWVLINDYPTAEESKKYFSNTQKGPSCWGHACVRDELLKKPSAERRLEFKNPLIRPKERGFFSKIFYKPTAEQELIESGLDLGKGDKKYLDKLLEKFRKLHDAYEESKLKNKKEDVDSLKKQLQDTKDSINYYSNTNYQYNNYKDTQKEIKRRLLPNGPYKLIVNDEYRPIQENLRTKHLREKHPEDYHSINLLGFKNNSLKKYARTGFKEKLDDFENGPPYDEKYRAALNLLKENFLKKNIWDAKLRVSDPNFPNFVERRFKDSQHSDNSFYDPEKKSYNYGDNNTLENKIRFVGYEE